MTTSHDVMEVLQALERAGLCAWVDGGWGVDALLGEQTRPHEDLDLVISLEHSEVARRVLEDVGFAVVEDELPTRLAMRDSDGRSVDLHTVTFDAAGNAWQELQDGRCFAYHTEGLKGVGVISGQSVRCLSPGLQLDCHLGYEPNATDRADMGALAARFGLKLPAPYA